MRALVCLAVCLAMAGCDRLPRFNMVGGMQPDVALPFTARLAPGNGAEAFAVTVDARGAGLPAARETARFHATRYCLRNFGSSDIVWRMAGGDWAVMRGANGALVVSGRCDPR